MWLLLNPHQDLVTRIRFPSSGVEWDMSINGWRLSCLWNGGGSFSNADLLQVGWISNLDLTVSVLLDYLPRPPYFHSGYFVQKDQLMWILTHFWIMKIEGVRCNFCYFAQAWNGRGNVEEGGDMFAGLWASLKVNLPLEFYVFSRVKNILFKKWFF